MAVPVGEIIDLDALWQMAAAALVAGAGLTLGASLVVLGVERARQARWQGRQLHALSYAAVGAIGAVLMVALIIAGLIEVTG